MLIYTVIFHKEQGLDSSGSITVSDSSTAERQLKYGTGVIDIQCDEK